MDIKEAVNLILDNLLKMETEEMSIKAYSYRSDGIPQGSFLVKGNTDFDGGKPINITIEVA